MEKNHLKGRNANEQRRGANGGYRGRGNASGSISYAEFRRNGGSKARDERNEKMKKESVRETASRGSGFGEKRSGFGEKLGDFGKQRSNFSEQRSNFSERRGNFGEHRDNSAGHRGNAGERRDNSAWHRGDAGEHRGNTGGKRFESSRFNTFGKTVKGEKREKKPRTQTQPTYERTQFVDYSKPMRLNRFLANAGVCSRREADSFIQAGVVTVNGNVVKELGSRVVPDTDKVLFHDELVKIERRVYILLNKPKDYVTTAEDIHAKKTVLDLVKGACAERIYPVGRLDRNTTGVLLITNDGELTSKLTHPSFNKKKIYQVTLDHDVEDADVQKITSGITLEDGEIKVDEFSFIKEGDRKNVGVEIHSGRNRIVRRIFESLGYKVMRLDRVYFAGLTKKNLPRGKWRFLSEKEVVFLKMNANNPTENC